MSDTSGKVLRGGCLGSVIGGVVVALLGGVLAALLSLAGEPLIGTGNVMIIFAAIGFLPGALIGALVGARRAASPPSVERGEPSESELARLKKRMEELEAKARDEAIHRKKGS